MSAISRRLLAGVEKGSLEVEGDAEEAMFLERREGVEAVIAEW